MTSTPVKSYYAAGDCYFYPGLGDTLPPGGADVLLLTKYGICIRGKWPSAGTDFYLGWAPLPKRNEAREAQLLALRQPKGAKT